MNIKLPSRDTTSNQNRTNFFIRLSIVVVIIAVILGIRWCYKTNKASKPNFVDTTIINRTTPEWEGEIYLNERLRISLKETFKEKYNSKTFSYYVEENSAADVDYDDDQLVITAKEPGEFRVICQLSHNNNSEHIYKITVKQDQLSFVNEEGTSIDRDYLYVEEKETIHVVSAAGINYSLDELEFTSSNSNVVKVNSKGVITALKEGIETIYVSRKDGFSTCVGLKVFVDYKKVAFKNGQLIKKPKAKRLANLTVSNDNYNQNYKIDDSHKNLKLIIYMKSVTNSSKDMSFTLKMRGDYTIKVPLGEYDIYYAYHDVWYGKKYLFGNDKPEYHKLGSRNFKKKGCKASVTIPEIEDDDDYSYNNGKKKSGSTTDDEYDYEDYDTFEDPDYIDDEFYDYEEYEEYYD